MNSTTAATERLDQKRRTREALLAGARALMDRGAAVTVTAAATEANVSKATAYRYFSDPAALAAEAGLAVKMAPYDEIVAGAEGTRARLLALTLHFFDLACDNEAAFRQFLARNLDAWLADGVARRGARRAGMFAAALDADASLPEADRAALVRALSAATGVEAMIALYDAAGASREEARATVALIAEAVIDRFLPARHEG